MPVNYQKLIQEVIAGQSAELERQLSVLVGGKSQGAEDLLGMKGKARVIRCQLSFLKILEDSLFKLLKTARYRSINLDEFIQALSDRELVGGLQSKKVLDYSNRLYVWQTKNGYGAEAGLAVLGLKKIIAGLVHNEYGFYSKKGVPSAGLSAQEVESIRQLMATCYQRIQEIAVSLKNELESGGASQLVDDYVRTDEHELARVPVSILKGGHRLPLGAGNKTPKRARFNLSGQVPMG